MFSTREQIELTVKVEEDGEKFYRKLSEKSEKAELREFFNYIADQEKEHAEKFRILGKEFKIEKMEYIDIEDAGEYLRSYVEGKIFPSLEKI